MKKLSGLKKKITASCAAGLITLSGIAGSLTPAWALPSSGRSVSDNIVVRESAVDGVMAGSLTEGQRVQIIGSTQGSDGYLWYHIEFELNDAQITGWVRSDLLRTGTEEEMEDETDSTESESASVHAEDATFYLDGKGYDIADEIPSSEIPDGFVETTMNYGNADVPALKSENGDVYLLYLRNADDSQDEELFVYDSDTEEVIPYINVRTEDGFIVLVNIPAEEKHLVSDRFAETPCPFENGTIMAYQLASADELIAEDADITDFYYVYGANKDGEQNWYVYDKGQNSIQRNISNMYYSIPLETVAEEPAEEVPQEPVSADQSSVNKMLVAALAVICLLLLILSVIFAARYRGLKKVVDSDDNNYVGHTKRKTEQLVEKDKSTVKQKTERTEKPKKGKKDNAQKNVELHTPAGRIHVMDLDDAETDYPDNAYSSTNSLPVEDIKKNVAEESAKNVAEESAKDVAEESSKKVVPETETANLEALIGEIVAAEEAKAAEEIADVCKVPESDETVLAEMEDSIHVSTDKEDISAPKEDLKDRILREADEKKNALSKSEKDIEAILRKGLSEDSDAGSTDDDLKFL